TGDLQALRWLESLDARDTRLATTAERALLRAIEGGCQVPVGALGSVRGERLQLQAAVCALDGSQLLSATGEAAAELTAAAELGRRLAQELLAQGAARLIAQERAARVEAP
ncbi:MAG: hypothetical protein JOZ12_04165, partial [Sinobacteraceae bacterium]|nr:hypothetical protein [Nevskiaceae bacterium]